MKKTFNFKRMKKSLKIDKKKTNNAIAIDKLMKIMKRQFWEKKTQSGNQLRHSPAENHKFKTKAFTSHLSDQQKFNGDNNCCWKGCRKTILSYIAVRKFELSLKTQSGNSYYHVKFPFPP